MPDQKKTPTPKKPAANPGRTYATDRQAIANLIGGVGAGAIPIEGVFVAVPARSWRPVTRKVQTVEKALWS